MLLPFACASRNSPNLFRSTKKKDLGEGESESATEVKCAISRFIAEDLLPSVIAEPAAIADQPSTDRLIDLIVQSAFCVFKFMLESANMEIFCCQSLNDDLVEWLITSVTIVAYYCSQSNSHQQLHRRDLTSQRRGAQQTSASFAMLQSLTCEMNERTNFFSSLNCQNKTLALTADECGRDLWRSAGSLGL